MKRLIKRPLRAIWRMTHPVRRPIVRKLEAFLARTYAQAQAPMPQPHVHVACNCRVTEETSLVIDYMVRELVRLQIQVDRLEQVLDDRSPSHTSFSVVLGADADGKERLSHSQAG
jgi:hypothetical protein